jgi:hypothetical protein
MGRSLHIALPEEHHVADELFLRHQEALLARDFLAAVSLLDELRRAVAHHIEVEEREVIPPYQARGPAEPGGDTALFLAEHRKIEAFLRDFADRIRDWPSEAPSPREVIALLDAETQYKHLMDHHDRRERAFLYPAFAAIEGGHRAGPHR